MKMMMKVVVVLCSVLLALVSATTPSAAIRNKLFYVETFDTDPFLEENNRRWVKSNDPKYADTTTSTSTSTSTDNDGPSSTDKPPSPPAARVGPSPTAAKGLESDNGLRLTKEKKHYGLASKFPTPLTLGSEHKELVVQYEVKLEETLNCGGAYIKLLMDTPKLDINSISGDTPYTIMFGPDKCGTVNKVHVILQHQNPLTGAWEEKHTNETAAMKGDKKTHLYTLRIKDDNSFEVYIDKKLSKQGNLLTHMVPPINPPKEIDDPTDSKPADWSDLEKIDDLSAVKPDDWDEDAPKEIENDKAVKPAGWLDDGPENIPDPKATKPVD
jgi:calnexin